MAHPLFDPANDLSLMLALNRCEDPDARAEALRLADENCRAAGHKPVSLDRQLEEAVGHALMTPLDEVLERMAREHREGRVGDTPIVPAPLGAMFSNREGI